MSAPKQSKPLNPNGQQSIRPKAQNQNRSKKTQKVKRRMKKAGPIANARVQRFQLSPCSYKYLKALTNPWSNTQGVCIPDLIDVPSAKFITWQRGTFNCNTAGVGWVSASAHSITSDGVSVIASRPGGTSITLSGLAAESTTHLNPQFPYTTAQLAAQGYQTRIVAVGLRARYTGTELNRSGRIISARCPSNQSFGAESVSGILSRRNNVESWPCDRDWHSITYLPQMMADYDYQTSDDVIPTVSSPGQCDLLVMVDGALVTANSGFEWECCRYYEVIPGYGLSSVDNLTPSHSDVPGMSAMRGFFEGNTDQESGSGLFQKALDYLSNVTPTEVSHFVDAGTRLYNMYSGL